jgi:hypothetical protein
MKKKFTIYIIKHKEYKIPVFSFFMFILCEMGGYVFGWDVVPVGYLSKFFFGMLGASLFMGVALYWLNTVSPSARKRIDPELDIEEEKKLSEWQEVKRSLFLLALYFLGGIALASFL